MKERDYKKHGLSSEYATEDSLWELLGELLSYTDDYFADKWHLNEQVAMWQEAIRDE